MAKITYTWFCTPISSIYNFTFRIQQQSVKLSDCVQVEQAYCFLKLLFSSVANRLWSICFNTKPGCPQEQKCWEQYCVKNLRKMGGEAAGIWEQVTNRSHNHLGNRCFTVYSGKVPQLTLQMKFGKKSQALCSDLLGKGVI